MVVGVAGVGSVGARVVWRMRLVTRGDVSGALMERWSWVATLVGPVASVTNRVLEGVSLTVGCPSLRPADS